MTTAMSETKHTPGPSRVSGSVISLPNFPHDDVCEVFNELDHTVTIPLEQARANAHLIAAAPVLLKALEDAARECGLRVRAWSELQHKLDAAIRKAKGE